MEGKKYRLAEQEITISVDSDDFDKRRVSYKPPYRNRDVVITCKPLRVDFYNDIEVQISCLQREITNRPLGNNILTDHDFFKSFGYSCETHLHKHKRLILWDMEELLDQTMLILLSTKELHRIIVNDEQAYSLRRSFLLSMLMSLKDYVFVSWFKNDENEPVLVPLKKALNIPSSPFYNLFS